MSKFFAALASLVRTLVWLTVLVLLVWGGWLGYRAYDARSELTRTLKQREAEITKKNERIERLTGDLRIKQQQVDKLDLALRLMKVDRRVAELTVLEQWKSKPADTLMTKFQFTEVDGDGKPLGQPKVFTIDGNVVYIDAWVVKFSDELVQAADPLRGASVAVFRRVFGENQEPSKGYVLDAEGQQPVAYGQAREPSAIEKEIWANFWELANDPQRAKQAGVRVAQGEAPSIQLRKGMVYPMVLRASGGLNILPAQKAPPGKAASENAEPEKAKAL